MGLCVYVYVVKCDVFSLVCRVRLCVSMSLSVTCSVYSVSSPSVDTSHLEVARTQDTSHSRLHFAHSTRTVSAAGSPRADPNAFSLVFRALDTHDLRRGFRGHRSNRTLTCVSRTRHARSPQGVARAQDKSHSRPPFARATRTISAQGRARIATIALSPALRALHAHDLRRGLRGHGPNRTLACILRTRHA